ncbi:MAG: DJ-1/PfpI family protein [Planctomycetota bacterium]|jgi:protease I
MAAKKILMIVGDYTEDYEAIVPFQALAMVGHTVHAVCPDKKEGETVRTAVNYMDGAQFYREDRGHDFALNATFADIAAADYDALLIPGGRMAEYIRMFPQMIETVQHFARENKPMAVLCHGLQVLIGADLCKGRKLTGFPTVGCDLKHAGAEFLDKGLAGVVVDGNLVTGASWYAHSQWLAKFLELLGTKITP